MKKRVKPVIHIPGTTLRERWAQAMLERIEADMMPEQRRFRDAVNEALADWEQGMTFKLIVKP